jgi:hypothetical protein
VTHSGFNFLNDLNVLAGLESLSIYLWGLTHVLLKHAVEMRLVGETSGKGYFSQGDARVSQFFAGGSNALGADIFAGGATEEPLELSR